jgi:aryl-alcohol dehydrogenase-like predicted oxidoreductase
MEFVSIPGTNLNPSRIGLGTWAIGGWMWGGSDEEQSIRTIHAALDRGIKRIDTAPVYGFGRSEEIVAKALGRYGQRDQVILATKVWLEWKDAQISRKCHPSADPARDRGLAAAPRHRLHRYLPGALARSGNTDRGYRPGHGFALPAG